MKFWELSIKVTLLITVVGILPICIHYTGETLGKID